MSVRLIVFLVLASSFSGFADYDVFFLCGQSNASGRTVSGFVPDERDARVKYYYRTDGPGGILTWSGAEFLVPLGTLPTGYYGPEISLGRRLVDLGYNPVIIKVSRGGASLYEEWNSRVVSENPVYGRCWRHWKFDAAAALELLDAPFTLRGFFWLQGETDSNYRGPATDYKQNFRNLLSDVTFYLQELGQDTSSLHFVTCLTLEHLRYSVGVRQAQRKVMDERSRAGWFDGGYLLTMDGVHYTEEGNRWVGTSFADLFLEASSESLTGITKTNAGLQLSWMARPGVSYLLRCSADLIHWRDYLDLGVLVPVGSAATEYQSTLDLSAMGDRAYFRVRTDQ